MSDLTFVIGTGISNKLLENSTLAGLITQSGAAKIYQLQAPDDGVDRPYIIMRHSYGGEENKEPHNSFDVTWLVYAVADDQALASEIAGLIKTQLTNQELTFPDGWSDWAGVTTISVYSVVDNNQNIQRWKIGEYYRIRGTK